jgi:hypothetical protein
MKVIPAIVDYRCGACGTVLHQAPMDRLATTVELQCWTPGCDQFSKVSAIEVKVIDVAEVQPG